MRQPVLQNRYAARTLLVISLLSISMAALGQWQDGDFSGDLNWQGTVTQNRNPWVWGQGELPSSASLNLVDAQTEDHNIVWHNLLTQTPLLLGKTEVLMPSGRTGVSPMVQFGEGIPGFRLDWKGGGVVDITIPVTGHRESSQAPGRFTFSMRVAGLIVATSGGGRHGYGVVAGVGDNSNGIPPSGLALPYPSALSMLQNLAGQDSPSWLTGGVSDAGMATMFTLSEPQNHAVGAMYGVEILPGSGTLRFPAGKVPERWHVSLPVRITYR